MPSIASPRRADERSFGRIPGGRWRGRTRRSRADAGALVEKALGFGVLKLHSEPLGGDFKEANLPGAGGAEMVEMAATMFDQRSADYPHLAEFTTEHVLLPDYRFADSFDFGLDLILDGLARAASTDERARATPSVEPKT